MLLYTSKRSGLISPVLQLQAFNANPDVYQNIITKSNGQETLNYLQDAPEKASNLILALKNKSVLINGISSNALVVDIRFNGININYCDTQNLEVGCTVEEFNSKIQRIIYPDNQFIAQCSKPQSKSSKWIFFGILILVILGLVHKFYKTARYESFENLKAANIAKRNAELKEEAQGLGLSEPVDVDVEVSLEKANAEDIDLNLEPEVEIEVEIDPVDVQGEDVDLEVNVDLNLDAEVEVQLDAENPLEAKTDVEVGLMDE